MDATPSAPRGPLTSFVVGALFIAFGIGMQWAFAPTVRVSCPARTATAPDCDLRSYVAYDMLQVRHEPLPGLQPGNEIVSTTPGSSRKGGAITMFLKTSAGPVRALMWGDHLSLQRDLRDPLASYFENPQSPAIDLTMKPSRWTDPGGNADNRLVRHAHPVRFVANGAIAIGLLYLLAGPVQLMRRSRA